MKRRLPSGGAGLIGMRDDARIEQRRRLKRIFVQKVGADQLALHLRERSHGGKRVFHFIGARFECLQQVAMATLEVLQDIGQLTALPSPDRARGPGRQYGWRASCRWD